MLNRGKGLVGFIGAGYQYPLTSKLTLNAKLDLSFANAEHMFTELGINKAKAKATSYRTNTPRPGYKGITTLFGFEYSFTSARALQGDFAVEHYGNNMSDSALIAEQGTDTTI